VEQKYIPGSIEQKWQKLWEDNATFAAVEKDLALAAASGLACFGIAAERAAALAQGPASFKEKLIDNLYRLDPKTAGRFQKVYRASGTFCQGKRGTDR